MKNQVNKFVSVVEPLFYTWNIIDRRFFYGYKYHLIIFVPGILTFLRISNKPGRESMMSNLTLTRVYHKPKWSCDGVVVMYVSWSNDYSKDTHIGSMIYYRVNKI